MRRWLIDVLEGRKSPIPARKIRYGLIKLLFGGKVPISPKEALWELIETENKKDPDDIRCDHVEAWLEAVERVRNYR